MRSLAAFEAAYGELGNSGQLSVQAPDSIEPYTSSVETCTTRAVPAATHASSSSCVPETFVRTNAAGSVSDLSTCDSAAKCTTASWPGTVACRVSGSVTSPVTTVSRGWPTGRLVRLPAYVSLSSTVISAPASSG